MATKRASTPKAGPAPKATPAPVSRAPQQSANVSRNIPASFARPTPAPAVRPPAPVSRVQAPVMASRASTPPASMARPAVSTQRPQPVAQARTTTPAVSAPQQMAQQGTNRGILSRTGPVTQVYGQPSRYNIFSGNRSPAHEIAVPVGTQINAPPGQWVVKTAFGTASQRGYIGNFENQGWGNNVILKDMQTGEEIGFNHLSQVAVQPGQRIQAGQFLGATGTSGNSTGPHVAITYRDNQGRAGNFARSQYAQYLRGGVPQAEASLDNPRNYEIIEAESPMEMAKIMGQQQRQMTKAQTQEGQMFAQDMGADEATINQLLAQSRRTPRIPMSIEFPTFMDIQAEETPRTAREEEAQILPREETDANRSYAPRSYSAMPGMYSAIPTRFA